MVTASLALGEIQQASCPVFTFRPNVYRSYTSDTVRDQKIHDLALSAFAHPPKRAPDINSWSRSVLGRSVGLAGVAFGSAIEGVFRLVRWITHDTKQLKKIEATERILLETHFSELNADSAHLVQGVSKVARFIPFLHAPVFFLVNSLEKANHENLKFVEKCSKVALSTLSFIPKLAMKTCSTVAGFLQKSNRYPLRYCQSLVQKPDTLSDDLSSLVHRVASGSYSLKRAFNTFIGQNTLKNWFCLRSHLSVDGQFSSIVPYEDRNHCQDLNASICPNHGIHSGANLKPEDEIDPLECGHTSESELIQEGAFPLQQMYKTGWEGAIDRLNEKIGIHLVTNGTLYHGIAAFGSCMNVCMAFVGKGIGFPFMRAGKKGRCDLKVLTAISLKSAELYFASDKGAVFATTFLERIAPIQSVESFLKRGVEFFVHVPYRLVSYFGNFHEQLNAVRRLPSLNVELKKASDQATFYFCKMNDQWRDYCMSTNSVENMCSFDSFTVVNTTQRALLTLQKSLFSVSAHMPKGVCEKIQQNVVKLNDLTVKNTRFFDRFLSFFGKKSAMSKCAIVALQKVAVRAIQKELELVEVRQKIRDLSDSAFFFHQAALFTDMASRLIVPLLHIQWLALLVDSSMQIITAYGAPLFKFSLIGYDVNEKITETKKKLILSAQHVSEKALTKADQFVHHSPLSENSGWSWTFKLLKVVVPAGITLATSGTTALTTKLFQIVLPHMVASIEPEVLRKCAAYIGAQLPLCTKRGGIFLQNSFASFAHEIQSRWNQCFGCVDEQRLDNMKSLTLFERMALLELIQRSRHIPKRLEKIIFDEKTKVQFFTMNAEWAAEDWKNYCKAVLEAYSFLKEEEKVFLTPLFFLSLPLKIQHRIRNCVKGACAPDRYDDIEWLVTSFNALSVPEKQRVHTIGVDEFLTLSQEAQYDLLALIAVSTNQKNVFKSYQSWKKYSKVQLEPILALFPTIRVSDFACLTPSQALRLRVNKLEHVLDLLSTYKRWCLDELREAHPHSTWCVTWRTLKQNLMAHVHKSPHVDQSWNDIIEHVALLFSTLNVREREELLKITPNELSSMTSKEQSVFLVVFQAHIQEWIDKGKSKDIFSYSAGGKIQPCLDFLSSSIKKLSQEVEPKPSLMKKEEETVLSYFNATTPLFQSDCRMHMEEKTDCLTESQVAHIVKEIEDIDLLYKTSLQSMVKIQLSAGHFLKEAMDVQEKMDDQERKGILNYVEKTEFMDTIALRRKAKEQRMQELEQYQVIINHLKGKREERTNLLKMQQLPIPPLPALSHEDILNIVGIFSPLVDDFRETECSLAQAVFEKSLETRETKEEKVSFASVVLKESAYAIHLVEEKISAVADVAEGMGQDAKLLAFYKKHMSREIDLFMLSVAKTRHERLLSVIAALSLQ